MKNTKVFVPPIKIQGIKTKLVPLIKENIIIDKNTTWVEPFMGSGVVGFNVMPYKAVFADTNPYIVEFYQKIQCGEITSFIVREFLEREGKLLEREEDDYYYSVRERFNREHNVLDFLFLNRSCFNGMIRFNKNYQFNVPYGHKPQRFAKAYITKIVNQVKHLEKIMLNREWQFICQSFEETIKNVNDKAFIYCDPPYIGRNVDYYDSWDEASEIKLCNVLVDSQAKFMLSTWDYNQYRKNKYIDKIWSFCNKINKEHFYHVGANEVNRKPMVEALMVNYSFKEAKNKLYIENEQLSLLMEQKNEYRVM